jgi:hypothetical protein
MHWTDARGSGRCRLLPHEREGLLQPTSQQRVLGSWADKAYIILRTKQEGLTRRRQMWGRALSSLLKRINEVANISATEGRTLIASSPRLSGCLSTLQQSSRGRDYCPGGTLWKTTAVLFFRPQVTGSYSFVSGYRVTPTLLLPPTRPPLLCYLLRPSGHAVTLVRLRIKDPLTLFIWPEFYTWTGSKRSSNLVSELRS